jgi:predicted NACHT family NTPase
MKFLNPDETAKLKKILTESSRLKTPDERDDFLTCSGLKQYSGLFKIDEPSDDFAVSLLAKLSEIYIADKRVLVIFLEYLNLLDSSLSLEDQDFIKYVIDKSGREIKTIPVGQDLAEINALVQDVRSCCHDKIQQLYGKMRMLDISQPVDLGDIFVDVNILEKLTSERWLDISDLKNFEPDAYGTYYESDFNDAYEPDYNSELNSQEEPGFSQEFYQRIDESFNFGFSPEFGINRRWNRFDRFGLGKVRQARVPGLEAVKKYPRLMVLGKPGAGKTTFLQYLAIECNEGRFQPGRVPIFIRLKTFAEDARDINTGSFMTLQDYIHQEFNCCGILEQSVTETILKQGRAMILLDGLDEVSETDDDEIVKQIRRFTQKYFKNQLIITCRIAARKYRFREEQFTPVEVADFSPQQIESFAKKWFVAFSENNRQEGLVKAGHFIESLNQQENSQIRELAITPILLNLTCLVFQDKNDFPSKRSNLYEQGLDILLVKWDEDRCIHRDEVYRNLTVPRKKDLLSYVAAISFEEGNYFFEQDKIQQLIADYLRTLPDAKTASNEFLLDSEAVLKSIEAQHGLLVERARKIYSFSHLTFQEYFTAQEIVREIRTLITESDLESLKRIANYVPNRGWREVFLLVAEKSWNIDELLQFKKMIDSLLASDEKFQQFLRWVEQKSRSVEVSYKPLATRAFYFAHAVDSSLYVDVGETCLWNAVDRRLPSSSSYMYELELNLRIDRSFTFALKHAYDLCQGNLSNYHLLLGTLTQIVNKSSSLSHSGTSINSNLLRITHEISRILAIGKSIFRGAHSFQELVWRLKIQLPDPNTNIRDWWHLHGKDWTEQLRNMMIKYRDIGHDWSFYEEQKELMKQYYYANKLLIDCLNNGCSADSKIIQEIEETLLLPIAEIEKSIAS